MNVVGYVRVSTADQGSDGAGMTAQREQIQAECERRGWQLLTVEEDVASGGSTRKRPGLDAALQLLETGEAKALVVAKLDRLSRSLADFAAVVERSRKHKWELVVLDLAVDTTTPNGEAMAGMLAVFAQWERRLIGQRTREALAVRKAQGVTLGRPRQVDDKTRELVKTHRQAGHTFQQIADLLNLLGHKPVHGGRQWYRSTVRSLL